MKSLMRPGTGRQVLWMTPRARVTVLDVVGDDAHGEQVVDLLDGNLLAAQLLPDAVEALDAALDARRNIGLLHLGFHLSAHLRQEFVADLAPALDGALQVFEGLGLQMAEGQVFQFAADFSHAQAVSDGSVDFQGLARDALAAVGRKVLERAHVVQAVGEFHQDDANVVHHGQDHLAEILRLLFFRAQKLDPADLGDALDDARHFRAEILLHQLGGGVRVLDHVVQHARRQADGVHLHVGEDVHHFQRMGNEGLAGKALLVGVLRGGEFVSAPEQREVLSRPVGLHLPENVFKLNHTRYLYSSRSEENGVAGGQGQMQAPES